MADQSTEPRLCSECQSFYGTAATNFMCSSCFKKAGGAQVKKPEPMAAVQLPSAAVTNEVVAPVEEKKDG